MSRQVVLKATDLSKFYKIYKKPFDRVKESLIPFSADYHRKFYAVQGISLELKRGEALGIIGRNGQGKSTFLKMVAGLLTPSSGAFKTVGKVAAILELTSNLRPELTGIENIEFNLRINGSTDKAVMAEKSAAIIEFSELGEFIHQPVRTYSSGMKSRLGFAIATSLEHDILILDEVLAVGDFQFQQKCLARINQMRDRISVIFVSHSMNSVRLFCDKAAVFEKGRLIFEGDTESAIAHYMDAQRPPEKVATPKKQVESKSHFGDLFHNKARVRNISVAWDQRSYRMHQKMVLNFSFELLSNIKNLVIGVPVWNESAELVTAFNTDFYNLEYCYDTGVVNGSLELPCVFNPSSYSGVFCINDTGEFLYRGLIEEFSVLDKERVFGFVTPEAAWRIDEQSARP